jgi:glutamyl-tRNA synthetase
LDRINPSNAVFDEKRLEWMNNQYIINRLTDERFIGLTVPYLIQAGLINEMVYKEKKHWVDQICLQMRPRLKVLKDITKVKYFFSDDFEYDDLAYKKYLTEDVVQNIFEYRTRITPIVPPVDDYAGYAGLLDVELISLANDKKISRARIIHPLRLFLTGTTEGPPLFETMALIGKEGILRRMDKVLDAYKSQKEKR